MNDLPNCLVSSEPLIYVADTHLTCARNNIEENERTLNQDFANISDSLKANKLILNKSKTEFMAIGSSSF